jgi:hypothetical protein
MEHDAPEGAERDENTATNPSGEAATSANANESGDLRKADDYLDALAKREKREALLKEFTFVKKAMDKVFTGEGKPDTCESNWSMFRSIFMHNMRTFDIAEEHWGTLLFNSIDGKALQVVLSKPELQTSFDSMSHYFAAGPFRQSHTDYSVRTSFYEPKYRVRFASQVKGLVQRFDKDANKAPTPMTEVEKIVALQYNLPAEVRAAVMLTENNTPFSSYDDFIRVLMARVNAMDGSSSVTKQPANVNGDQQRAPTPKRPRTGDHQQQQRGGFDKHRRHSDQQQRSNGATAGAPGSSNGGGGRANGTGSGHQPKPCSACGQPGHRPWEKKADGTPMCQHYDPTRAPKRPYFQRRS